MNILLRPTAVNDAAALPAVEHSAGQRFLERPDLAWLADGPGISSAEHRTYAERGMSWVALADGHPVGFVLAQAHPTSLFIVELSVHLAWQGKGIGRQLISCVADRARAMGLVSLTLTTFRDVPWNAPYYARLGFRTITALTRELREIREEEAAHGLAPGSRCAMMLPLDEFAVSPLQHAGCRGKCWPGKA
ncbi:GNAT family N-acetyltransferase [Enterobacter soli]|uniref:GNAT family N-acetyltransferase n=1 Tax=Enterobacter soli TaxID=885040 RepID=UPI0034CD31C6